IGVNSYSKKSSKMAQRPPKQETKPKTYTVRPGDTLWSISMKFYKTGSKVDAIHQANKKVIGKDPNKIYPGQKLVLP
ncbi:LysM peptidoglycan-binding domain-containing protein, partial [Anoxybacillus kestanbolensis]|uniref:LysM peptidoglycan-binding domain-containing protein n=1 Tax=Anoxybacillus kestanbolensis TaxID=227476 RepID=UPI003D24F0C0